MPRSSISMSDHDSDYIYNIDKYLIDNYPNINKPSRGALCEWVRNNLDDEVIENEIDLILGQYAIDLQGWTPPEEEDDDE
mgnify:CR=1 FL=1|jgi:hypothetical protein